MLLYIGISLFYVICMLIEKKVGKSLNRKVWTIVLIIPLFIIAAFRAPTVGNDTFNYYRFYVAASQEDFFSPNLSRLETGYVLYMRIVGCLGLSYLGFQIITSAFTMFSIGRFIDRYSNSIAFSLYIFVTTHMFFDTMNISRQYLAIAILLFSVEFIKDRNFIKFFTLVLIASYFHATAIIFLVIYPIARLRLNDKKTAAFIGIGIISSVFFDVIIRFFINIIGRYEEYLYGHYFNFEGNIAIYLHLLINLSFFCVAVLTKYWNDNDVSKVNHANSYEIQINENKSIKLISNERLWYSFCVLIVIFSIVGLNSTIMSRVESYFSVFFITFIPSLVKKVKSKEMRVLVMEGIVIGLLASFLIIMIYRPTWTTVFPYEWYWNWY